MPLSTLTGASPRDSRLRYIFLPDESVLSSGEEPPKHVIFPEHNSEEYANSTYKTMHLGSKLRRRGAFDQVRFL